MPALGGLRVYIREGILMRAFFIWGALRNRMREASGPSPRESAKTWQKKSGGTAGRRPRRLENSKREFARAGFYIDALPSRGSFQLRNLATPFANRTFHGLGDGVRPTPPAEYGRGFQKRNFCRRPKQQCLRGENANVRRRFFNLKTGAFFRRTFCFDKDSAICQFWAIIYTRKRNEQGNRRIMRL